MWQALLRTARRLLEESRRVWQQTPLAVTSPARTLQESSSLRLEPLARACLTDGVARTLFAEYAAHRASKRGADETGWVLLGRRDSDTVTVLATLPAGTRADTGHAHVLFNSQAQQVGSRIVRQGNRRLTIVGVVHTHPGSLRHPSQEDYNGDSRWVGQLRGGEGIFGIGTADGPAEDGQVGQQPRPNVQCLEGLRYTWYVLGQGDRQYRPLPVELILGPDLARQLHPVWPLLEEHADALDRLQRQQMGVKCEVTIEPAALVVTIPLANPEAQLRVEVREGQTSYFLIQGGDVFTATPTAERVDQAVYLLLAELARQG